MGTSASNSGPKGSPSLLPDWYGDAPPSADPTPPPPPEQDPVPGDPQTPPPPLAPLPASTPTENWKSAKGALTRLSNNTGGSSGRKAGNRYLNSLGGSRAATRAAAQGVSIGGRYASLLGAIASGGVTDTLRSLGLAEFIGRAPDEICAALANVLAPIGATNDEAIARDALISTMDTLYAKILDAGGNLDDLSSLSPDMVKETLIEYVSNFIFTKWMYELGAAIEKGNISEQQAVTLEREVKDLIFTETNQQYQELDVAVLDLNDNNNIALITDIFETAYSTLEL